MFQRSTIMMGVLASSGLLLGCVSDEEPIDDLEADEAEEVAGAGPEFAVLAAGDPYVASTTTGKAQNGTVAIRIPAGTAPGNLLLLVLHRTDDVNFWNGATQLAGRMTPDNVDDWNGPVAKCSFDNSAGDFDCAGSDKNDLNQVVYWKKATSADVGGTATSIDFPNSHPAWAIMARIPNGGASSNPVRAWKGQTSCDDIRGTRFPSVNGNSGDLLLLSSSFDDGAIDPRTGASGFITSSNFTAPTGFARNAYVIDDDEAGYLYSKQLVSNGATGTPASIGPESDGDVSRCKDIAVSIVIRKTGT
jgi:hypothetical protein